MRLFIAEKPSLARAIAAGLGANAKNKKGYIDCGEHDGKKNIVSWCVGHLLEQVEPHVYNPAYKRWNFADLPIIPQKWQWRAKASTEDQLNVLKNLVAKADEIIHAGDPDREGQLLVDEVFSYLAIPAEKRSKIKRLLINDLNLAAVKKQLADLKPNHDFKNLSISALARARADWLYGMNMSRAYTLALQRRGFKSVFSVGRVQTPLLGLIVKRDDEIENFVARDFYEVKAEICQSFSEKQQLLVAVWQPSSDCEPYLDEEGRVVVKKLAEHVANQIKDQPATVVSSKNTSESEQPPLPFSLSGLQIEAAKAFGFNAQMVLDICQNLYEKHKLITYPRSSNNYLPNTHFNDRLKIYKAISNNLDEYANMPEGFNLDLKGRAFNDKKVEAHHAIVPTLRTGINGLNDAEYKIYSLVAKQYLLQFYPASKFNKYALEFEIKGGKFTAQARSLVEAGYRALANFKTTSEKKIELPKLKKGDVLYCFNGIVEEKKTKPPLPFTDATLLQAMTNIARFVQNSDLKKVLRQTDGLGTEATRASIIELLFKRNFIEKKRRNIHATELGKTLIYSLPQTAITPDMTALWEQELEKMVQNGELYTNFMQSLTDKLQNLVIEANNI